MKPPPDHPRRGRRATAGRLIAILLLLVIGPLGLCWATGCMERLFYYPVAEPTPLPGAFPNAERVEFTSADGTPLVGWFLPAMGDESPGDAATILHTHGNAGNMNSHVWFVEYLPPAGFNVFLFDYRGYGESGGSASRRGPLIEDASAAFDVVRNRDDVDPDRIGLYGQSLGGAIGAVMLDRRPEIRAAVLESPFVSWRRIAADTIGGGSSNAFTRGLAAMLISDKSRPLDALATTKRSVLVYHGTADRTVPVSHSRAIADLARPNIEVMELEGGQHNSLRTSHSEVDALVIAFFRRELGSATRPANDDHRDGQ